MMIPAFLYGNYVDVKRASRKRVAAVKKGAPLDTLEEGDRMDTRSVTGLIALEGPTPALGETSSFHLFDIARAAIDAEVWRTRANFERDWLAWSLGQPWRLLSIFGQLCTGAFERNSWVWQPFLRAASDCWPVFDAEGARYTNGAVANDLWRLPTNLKFVLARLGALTPILNASLPPGGLAEFVKPFLRADEQ